MSEQPDDADVQRYFDELRRVLTIDGLGRPRKAEMLKRVITSEGNTPPPALLAVLDRYANLAY